MRPTLPSAIRTTPDAPTFGSSSRRRPSASTISSQGVHGLACDACQPDRCMCAAIAPSQVHIRSNRSRDTYRTGRHHAYARAGLGRYAPEKPWLVLWLHLSREHRCLPHLSTSSMHGGESTRCSIVLFEVQAPYRQPAARSSALAVISRRHCSAGTTAAQRPWLGGGLKPTAAAEQAQLRTRCEDHHPATPVAEPGCLEATPCVRPPLVHHKLRQRRRGRTGGPCPKALNSGGLTRA